MKYYTLYYLRLAAIILTTSWMVACDKVPANGKLDGMWKLVTIQTPEATRNVEDTQTFLSIQLQMVQWDVIGRKQFYSRFEQFGDSIRFYDFTYSSKHRDKEDDDEPVAPSQIQQGALDEWGIHTTDARYRTRQLDGQALVLEKADTVLFLRKF